jgi:hypothetical protein
LQSMEYKVLFHNPEELSDEELTLLRKRITFQRTVPLLTAAFFGFSSFVAERAVLRRTKCTKTYMALAAALGFYIGQ